MNEPISVVLVEDHALPDRPAYRPRSERRVRVVRRSERRHQRGNRDPAGASGRGHHRHRLTGRDGVALTRALKTQLPDLRVVILTMHELDDEVLAALSAGADAYCVKSSDAATVIDAVRIVAGGGAYFDPRIAHVVLRRLGRPRRSAAPIPRLRRANSTCCG